MAPVDDSRYVYEVLLDIECQMAMLMEPGVTTVTFFSGPKVDIRDRVKSICESNPWLVGTLVKNKALHKRNAVLRYPRSISDADLDRVYFDQTKDDLNSDLTFTELSRRVSQSAQVPSGNALLKQRLPVSKFTLARSSSRPQEFALVLSISHNVADGHTYYKILSMCSTNNTNNIEALDPTRKLAIGSVGKAVVGLDEHAYLLSGKTTINVIGKMIKGSKSTISAFNIDADKVKTHKVREDAHLSDNGNNKLPFSCSTNDILTSTFGLATKARILMMPINWRGRLDDCLDTDAGNYEAALVYDPQSYARSSDIRKSFQHGKSRILRENPMPLPKGCEALSCRLAMITSWVFPSYDGNLVLSNESHMTLHLPIFRTKGLPFPIAVVFRATPEQLGVIYAGPTDLTENLHSAGAPLGAPLHDQLFR